VPNENASVNDFTGKTVVVTGANSGIGLAAAEAFARGGARLGMVGRDRARLDEAVASVRAAAPGADVTAFRADFASLDSVRALAAELREAYDPIDVLANNAGGAIAKRGTTVDGFETTIGVNHLAPFLLTHLLRDRLAGGRVINTASDAHTAGKLDPANLNSDGPYRMFTVYGSSKQANILFAAEAARRWPEITSVSYHPGVVRTRFGRDSGLVNTFYKLSPFLLTPEKGADTMLWLAAAPKAEIEDGAYYVKRKVKQPSADTRSPEKAAALWDASERLVGHVGIDG
jgi:NAD(P)-dependent dehydrogenase (short-subunit alcohol dehydrogenase family)